MEKKCLLLSGGEYAPLPEDLRNDTKYDLVIACDRGLSHAEKLGVRPDLVIGDFDSYPGTEGEVSPDGETVQGIPVIRLNPVKDDTDTMSAVRYALEQGFWRYYDFLRLRRTL